MLFCRCLGFEEDGDSSGAVVAEWGERTVGGVVSSTMDSTICVEKRDMRWNRSQRVS